MRRGGERALGEGIENLISARGRKTMVPKVIIHNIKTDKFGINVGS